MFTYLNPLSLLQTTFPLPWDWIYLLHSSVFLLRSGMCILSITPFSLFIYSSAYYLHSSIKGLIDFPNYLRVAMQWQSIHRAWFCSCCSHAIVLSGQKHLNKHEDRYRQPTCCCFPSWIICLLTPPFLVIIATSLLTTVCSYCD